MTASIKALSDGLSGELQVGGNPSLRFGSDTSGQLASFRNKIINGNFDVWQRGTSFTAIVNSYTADRWVAYYGSGGSPAATLSRIVATPGTNVAMANGCNYYLSFNQTGAATTLKPFLLQRIENVRSGLGKTFTVSFNAWVTSGSVTLNVSMGTNYGTGGSAAEAATTSTPTITIDTNSETRRTATFVMPTGSGKTIVDTDSYYYLLFEFPLNSTYQVYFSGVQVEEGSIATPFEERPIGTELNLCYRYYYRISTGLNSADFGIAVAVSTVSAGLVFPYPVPLRAVPSTLEQSGTASHYAVSFAGTTTNCSSVPTLGAAANSYVARVVFTVASGLTAGQGGTARSSTTGSTAYLGFEAEL